MCVSLCVSKSKMCAQFPQSNVPKTWLEINWFQPHLFLSPLNTLYLQTILPVLQLVFSVFLLCLKKKNPILFWLKTAHNKCFQSTVAVVLLHMDKETPRTLERNLCCRLECGREVGFWCFTLESKGGRRGQKRIGPTPRAVFTLSMKFLSWIFPVTFIDFASKAHGGCWESPGLTLWIYQQSVSFLSIIETSEKIFVRNELFSILKQMCCIGIL